MFLDLHKVSNSSELNSFLLMCIDVMLLNRLRILAPLEIQKYAPALSWLQ